MRVPLSILQSLMKNLKESVLFLFVESSSGSICHLQLCIHLLYHERGGCFGSIMMDLRILWESNLGDDDLV